MRIWIAAAMVLLMGAERTRSRTHVRAESIGGNTTAFYYTANRYGDASWGLPNQTFDCYGYTSGNWDCGGGVTFTPVGSPAPTGGNATIWHPSGNFSTDTEVPAAGFDGAHSYFDAGDVLDEAGSFWRAVQFTTSTVAAGTAELIDKTAAADKSWALYRSAATVVLAVSKTGGTTSTITIGTGLVAGVTYTVVGTYEYVADGTSKLRGAISGASAPTEITNAVGPPSNSATVTRIGSDGEATPGSFFSGKISRISGGSGALTQAQLNAAVSDQLNLTARTGQTISVSRAASEACQPVAGGQVFYVPSNTLCVSGATTGEDAGAGGAFYGARTNRMTSNQRATANTETFGLCGTSSTWTVSGTATCALSATPAPDGTLTAEDISVGTLGANDISETIGSYTNNALLPGTSLWIRRISTTGTFQVWNRADATKGRWDVNLSAVPAATWVRLRSGSPYVTETIAFAASAAGQAGMRLTSSNATPVSVTVHRAWQTEAQLGPDAETAGSALVVPATIPSFSNPLPVGGISRCIAVLGSLNSWATPTVARSLFNIGGATTGANNGLIQFYTDGNVYADFFDSSGNRNRGYASIPVWSAGSAHAVSGCTSASAIKVGFDNVPATTTQSIAGNSTTSSSSTMYPAVATSAGALEFNGNISSIRVCTGSSNPKDCRP